MPLAAQALLPFVALLVAALIVRWRPRRRINGWIAGGATGIAGIIALVELLRLAPGEHVDVPYLTTFPYADLAVRLDGLSLAYATTTLITAAALMVTRQLVRGDRRDPWFGWLLTSAAACAVILADNLLLLFIALQLLTLAWSGALDETARRRRGLRLTVQIAAIGLLLTAASTWLWLLLIPLAGLVSVRVAGGSLAETLTLVNLAMVPGSIGFLALWLGGLALGASGLLYGIIPVAFAVLLLAIAALGRAWGVRSISVEPASIWGGVLLVSAAIPIIAMNAIVLPAAATARLVPRRPSPATPCEFATSPGAWPALLVTLTTGVLLGIAGWRLRDRLPLRRARGIIRWRISWPSWPPVRPPAVPAWSRYLLWGAFLVVVAVAVARP